MVPQVKYFRKLSTDFKLTRSQMKHLILFDKKIMLVKTEPTLRVGCMYVLTTQKMFPATPQPLSLYRVYQHLANKYFFRRQTVRRMDSLPTRQLTNNKNKHEKM